MLLASVKGEQATKAAAGLRPPPAAPPRRGVPPRRRGTATDVETKAEPEAGDATQTEDTVTETADVGPAAKASPAGSSLFDTPAPENGARRRAGVLRIAVRHPCAGFCGLGRREAPGGDPGQAGRGVLGRIALRHPGPEPEAAEGRGACRAGRRAEAKPARAADDRPRLRWLALRPRHPRAGACARCHPAAPPAERPSPPPPRRSAAPAPTADLGSGGSLFDIAAPEPVASAPAAAETAAPSEPVPPSPRPPTRGRPRRPRRHRWRRSQRPHGR